MSNVNVNVVYTALLRSAIRFAHSHLVPLLAKHPCFFLYQPSLQCRISSQLSLLSAAQLGIRLSGQSTCAIVQYSGTSIICVHGILQSASSPSFIYLGPNTSYHQVNDPHTNLKPIYPRQMDSPDTPAPRPNPSRAHLLSQCQKHWVYWASLVRLCERSG